MGRSAPENRATVVLLATGLLCTVLILFGTACIWLWPPPPPPPSAECTTNDDCDPGEVCNTDTGDCEAAPTGECQTAADCAAGLYCTGVEDCVDGSCQFGPDPCAEGELCDEVADECVANENLYDVTRVDADYENRVHSLPSGHMNCTVCHHAADADAGIPDANFTGCLVCHSEDPNVASSFKKIAHDDDADNNGCRGCHDDERNPDGTWDCSFCHPLVE